MDALVADATDFAAAEGSALSGTSIALADA